MIQTYFLWVFFLVICVCTQSCVLQPDIVTVAKLNHADVVCDCMD